MPTLKILDGVKVEMYFRDHLPPHIHASYNEYEELIEIRGLANYAGFLPTKQRVVVIKWMKLNQAFLLEKWLEFSG
jgi:Domain of unknown function (DUF4160)